MAQTAKEQSKKPKAPKGWFMAGANPDEFDAEIDKSESHTGTRCAHMYSNESLKDDSAWGTLMQQMSPGDFLEQRVRMSLWVKTKGVEGWVAPWMRVDGTKRGETLSFDNMCKRQVKGSTGWTKYEIVLDVPKESTNVAFGVMLGGKGDVWIDDFSFEKVGSDVPVTDCPCSSRSKRKTPAVNLNFEEDDDDDEVSTTWVELKKLPVKKEGKIKSLHSNTCSLIRFENETNKTITVYWLDFDGKRQHKGVIEPFGVWDNHQTFDTHPWLLADEDDRGLALFVAGTSSGFGILKLN